MLIGWYGRSDSNRQVVANGGF